MWNDVYPLWLRPQYSKMRMYKQGEFLQVVGHTPVKKITQAGDIISCDVFLTYADGSPIGTREYLVVDTVEKRYCVVG